MNICILASKSGTDFKIEKHPAGCFLFLGDKNHGGKTSILIEFCNGIGFTTTAPLKQVVQTTIMEA